MWDDLLRVTASVKGGHVTAALVVGKLYSSKRQQNALASAIKEYGALRRTVYAARYLASAPRKQVHSFLATSGPVMRSSSGKVAAMMPRAARIPPAVMR